MRRSARRWSTATEADGAIAAWLDHVRRATRHARAAAAAAAAADGPFATRARSALAARRAPARVRRASPRAARARRDRAGYLERGDPHKKPRNCAASGGGSPIRRDVRRCARDGRLGIARALGDFLALEAGGWKGRAGSAARPMPILRHSWRRRSPLSPAKAGAHRSADARRATHRRAAITLRSGDTAWFWKIAYDEALARLARRADLARSDRGAAR